MKRLLGGALVALLLAGCGSATQTEESDPYETRDDILIEKGKRCADAGGDWTMVRSGWESGRWICEFRQPRDGAGVQE